MKRQTIIIVGIALAVLTACNKSGQTVVVASKPVTEQYIIAEMLTLLIEEKSDLRVKQTLGIGGGTSNIHPALMKGEIDLYPEYTGTSWLMVLKRDPVFDPQQLYRSVKDAYEAELNLHYSGLYGFNNTYEIAVRTPIAQEYGLVTVSDLAAVSKDLVFAANPDFLEREDGFVGLAKTYGLTFKAIKEIDIGLRYEAVASLAADVIPVFTTDSRLMVEDVVPLVDDRNYFTSYHAATVVRIDTLKKYPALGQILELLTDQISDRDMVQMNYQVEIEKQDPKEVARSYLTKKGLL